MHNIIFILADIQKYAPFWCKYLNLNEIKYYIKKKN